MMRNWTVLKFSSVIALALAVAPAVNGQSDGPPDAKDDEKLKEIEKKVDALLAGLAKVCNGDTACMKDLNEKLAKLKETTDNLQVMLSGSQDKIALLEQRVDKLRKDIDNLLGRDKSMYPPVDKAGFDEILRRLIAIEAALKAGGPSVSYSKPTIGRIKLSNMYGEEMLFVINGKAYRVAPFTYMMLEDQPAGVFTYEVISGTYGSRAKNAPTLVPGDTYIITVK